MNPSITNFIEIIRIDSLCNPGPNKIYLRTYPQPALKYIAQQLSISTDYTLYTPTATKLIEINRDTIPNLLQTYIFVAPNTCTENLFYRVNKLYRFNLGAEKMGDESTSTPIWYPYTELPSRNLIFR